MTTTPTRPPVTGEGEAIRTPDQRIRVFVSSTLGELAAERVAVRAAVERLHLTPVMFEGGARPHPPRDLYRAYLRQSHVFVGVYHQRYGWVAPGEDVSGLEDEFRLSAGMPRLLYLKHPTGAVEPGLRAMVAAIRQDGTASYRRFTDADELTAMVEEDLAALLSERFMLRPAPSSASSPSTAGLAPPLPLTPTVGRERDIEAVTRMLHRGARLLTITGLGGVGKSRLALEVARAAADGFDGGVVFVPLEGVTRADAVLRAVAGRLHVADGGSRPVLEVLVEELRERRLLLVVDNMEQVAAAGPDLAELLGRCSGLSALVTSRHVLRLRGEREYHLQPLPLPGREAGQSLAQVPSVDLFVQRAAAVAPGFDLTAANGPVVAELVRVLDGLPLAIELAAARSRLFSPAALLERLTRTMDVLAGGAGDLPPRQRTQRATLDWSFDLLSPAEQALFARLSVFTGGASLDAVEAVCGDGEVPDVLGAASSLLEKSLLVSSTEEGGSVEGGSVDGAGGGPRVRMLQTVRSRAGELLAARGGAAASRARHARWYADLAEPADVLRHARAPRHWPALEAEAGNLRAAAQWAVETSDGPLVVDLTRRLWPWLWTSGRVGELHDTLLGALASLPGTASRQEEGYLRYVASVVLTLTGELPDALRSAERALQRLEGLTDQDTPVIVAHTRLVRGTLLMGLERSDGVLTDLDAAVEVARGEDNAWLLAYSTSHRGMARAMRGDTAGARTDHEESLVVAEAMGHEVLVAQALGQLAVVDALEGRLEHGAALVRRQVEHLRLTRNLEGLANALDAAAALAVVARRWETAARAVGAAGALRQRIRLAPWPPMRKHHDASTAAVREHLGRRSADVVAEAGRADPWAVVADALDRLEAPSAPARPVPPVHRPHAP